jgi:hypothetical protein
MIVTHKIGADGLAAGDRIYFGTPYGNPYIVKSVDRLTRGDEVWYAVRFTLGGETVNAARPYYYLAEDLFDVEVEI